MHAKRFLIALIAVFVCACAGLVQTHDVEAAAKTLAPTGELRVGVYLGSPTSMVMDPKNAQPQGVAFELGHALAKAIHRPVRVVQFDRVAQVIEALKLGEVDITFTNATAARAKDVDFTAPLVRLELGVLVPVASPVKQFKDVDDAAFRLGVAKGSSSQTALGAKLSLTKIVPVDSLDQAKKMLMTGALDGFATNKGILFEMNEHLNGFKVLDDRWGFENLAIAIPKGRDPGMPFLAAFAKQQQSTGEVAAMAQRAGLRGIAKE